VGRVCGRVGAEAGRGADLLAGLSRIGIDEISHRKGHRYLTVVVCHDTGRLVWAAPGRDKKTVEAFFDALGPERTRRLQLVSCDMARWIEAVLADRCPNARRCVDPFHVCQRPSVSPQWRTFGVPAGGHVFSPLVAVVSPRLGWVDRGGVAEAVGRSEAAAIDSARSGQWHHPFSFGCLGEPVAVGSFGDDHVGVVEQPVDGRGGEGAWHQLVEA
jgi:hypothetical protein